MENQIFNIRNILKTFYDQRIIFKQAYDSISKKKKLCKLLTEFKLNGKTVKLVKFNLENSNSKVKVQGKLSK